MGNLFPQVRGGCELSQVVGHQIVCTDKELVQAGKPGAVWSWWLIPSKWYFSDELVVLPEVKGLRVGETGMDTLSRSLGEDVSGE